MKIFYLNFSTIHRCDNLLLIIVIKVAFKMLQINASLALHKKRIFCTYRTEHLFGFDSKSFLAELNDNFEPISVQRLYAGNNNTAFEDVRLFSFGDNLLAFYSYFPQDENANWRWEFGVGVGIVDTDWGIITNQISLRGFSKRKHEKNWCPYQFNDEIFLITDLDPFVRVLRMANLGGDLDIYEVHEAKVKTEGWKYGELRGGTPLLPQPGSIDGWVYGFAHSYLNDQMGFARHYYYTIIRYNHYTKTLQFHPTPLDYEEIQIDEEYNKLWQHSNQKKLKVIFPMGIIPWHDGVMVSFGKDDVLSIIKHYKWTELINYFQSI